MSILDLAGKRLGAAATPTKKAHDHEEHQRFRQQYNTLFATLWQRFLKDALPPEGGPDTVRPDMAALRAVVEGEWRTAVQRALESSVPIELDPELMTKQVDGYLKAQELETRKAMPLHVAGDLADFGLTMLGVNRDGATVWMSHEVGLVVGTTGRVSVRLRSARATDRDWFGGADWMHEPDAAGAMLCTTHWTIGELFALLQALRRQHVTSLSPEQAERMRGLLSTTNPA